MSGKSLPRTAHPVYLVIERCLSAPEGNILAFLSCGGPCCAWGRMRELSQCNFRNVRGCAWAHPLRGELTEVSVEGRGSDKKEVIPHRLRNVKPQEFSLMNFIPF